MLWVYLQAEQQKGVHPEKSLYEVFLVMLI
jgi:hypothetical protein